MPPPALTAQEPPPPLPASAAPAGQVAWGVAALAAGLWLVFSRSAFGTLADIGNATRATAFLVLWLGLVMGTAQYWSARHTPARQRPGSRVRRVLHKWLGLHLVLGAVAGVYWALPEYRGALYQPFLRACLAGLPAFSLLALPYIAWVDARMAEPDDLYARLGQGLLAGDWAIGQPEALQFALGWLVKAFFLPLMFGYAVRDLQAMPRLLTGGTPDFRHLFELCFRGLYLVDVLWGAVGYLWSLRALDSHLRSTEPTLGGWLVALVCYEPLSRSLWPAYLAYDAAGRPWGHWLGGLPGAYMAWGCAILALTGVYTWATVSFGLRFSNLTHRGIVTSGPYRWLRHPAYVAKNLSWWLISMPFMVASSPADSLRHCLLLLAVNALYAVRARTEERHLAHDPVYRVYLAHMAGRRARLLGRLRAVLRPLAGRPAPAACPPAVTV